MVFLPGFPDGNITLGQHYNVGEKDTTLGQQYGVGEKDTRKAKTEVIVPHQA